MARRRSSYTSNAPTPTILFPITRSAFLGSGTAGVAAAWPSASLAIYFPYSVPVDTTLATVSYNGGAGASAGRNVDIGVYAADATGALPGTLLAHTGATAFAVGNQTLALVQALTGGTLYYLAMSCNNATPTFFRQAPSALQGRALGLLQEASAEPLNATATAVQYAQTYIPILGLTFTGYG